MAAQYSAHRLFMLYPTKPAARLRVFAFPPVGGGGATFPFLHPIRGLPAELAAAVLILPGRLGHPGKPEELKRVPVQTVNELADDIEPFIGDDQLPFVFLGMSLGAILAFQLIHELKRRGRRLPLHFYTGGKQAPHPHPLAGGYVAENTLPLDGLKAILRKYGGTPEQLLEDKAFMEAFVPMIRADFELNYASHERFRGDAAPEDAVIDIPITTWQGRTDTFVNADKAKMWSEYTRSGHEYHLTNGGHYFFAENKAWAPEFFGVLSELIRTRL